MNAEKRVEIEKKLGAMLKEFDELEKMIGAEYILFEGDGAWGYVPTEMGDALGVMQSALKHMKSQLTPPATKPTFKPGSGISFKRKRCE